MTTFLNIFMIMAMVIGLSGRPTLAMNPVKNCHCFKKRSYNPAEKSGSDPYLLTTTTNSFISSRFGFDKKKIVMMKMKGGIGSDDLLIGLYLVSLTKVPIQELMDQRQQGVPWKTILLREGFRSIVKGDAILASLHQGIEASRGAEQITDLLASYFFSVEPATINSLRARNFSSKELTLLLTLATKSQIDVQLLADLAQKQKLSYSEIAFNLGFQPGDMKTIIREIKP